MRMKCTLNMPLAGVISLYTGNVAPLPYPKTAWRVSVQPGFPIGKYVHHRRYSDTMWEINNGTGRLHTRLDLATAG